MFVGTSIRAKPAMDPPHRALEQLMGSLPTVPGSQGMWRLKSKREPVYLLIYIYILILNTGTYMDSLMFFFKTASERILGMLQRYWQPTQT